MSASMNVGELIDWLKDEGFDQQSTFEKLKEEQFNGHIFCSASNEDLAELDPSLKQGPLILLRTLRDKLKKVITEGKADTAAKVPPSSEPPASTSNGAAVTGSGSTQFSRPSGPASTGTTDVSVTGLSYPILNEKFTMPLLTLLEWTQDGSKQELRLIEDIAKNWRKLGSAGLGMKESVLNNLEDKLQNDVKSCRKVLEKFLENGSPNFKTPNWGNLIEALKKAEMTVVASTLQGALCASSGTGVRGGQMPPKCTDAHSNVQANITTATGTVSPDESSGTGSSGAGASGAIDMSHPILRERPTVQLINHIKYRRGSEEKSLRLIKKITPHWQDVARALGYSPADIKIIAKKHVQDPVEAAYDVLTQWMGRDTEHSWAKLIGVLREAAEELNTVASDLHFALTHRL